MAKSIKTFHDIVSIMSYVFQSVPWTIVPYTGKAHKQVLKNIDAIRYLKERFNRREIGGWCGLNCEFFKRILIERKFEVASFNYGIEGLLTHITILVKIDGMPFLFDPYFNRYYAIDKTPIPFDDLMKLVDLGATEKIESIYGNHVKPIQQSNGTWTEMTGAELEQSVLGDEKRKPLQQELMRRFGNPSIFNMMKINIPT